MFNITVWVAEGFLALFFALAGLPKIFGKGINRWVGFDEVPGGLTILIGICEIAAAVGLIVPVLVGRVEWTTPLAGIGIVIISLMASGFHLRNREWLAALETVLWASLAGSVAAARWDKFATGPSLSGHDVVLLAQLVVVPAVIINLAVLTRATSPNA
ncbi:DoxX family protein [Kribbella karoonensis]|uniref:DoxX family protein n=1 Tax=Kribbella karoonensis TaxID=324851 RepID=UPI0031DC4C46